MAAQPDCGPQTPRGSPWWPIPLPCVLPSAGSDPSLCPHSYHSSSPHSTPHLHPPVPNTPHLPGCHHHPMCPEQGGRQNRPLWPLLGTVICQGCGNTQPPSYLHHSGLAQPPGPQWLCHSKAQLGPNLLPQASDVEGSAPRCPPCYPARLSPLPPCTPRSRSRTAPQPPAGGAAGGTAAAPVAPQALKTGFSTQKVSALPRPPLPDSVLASHTPIHTIQLCIDTTI